ncbi:MAG: GEVED domain-containing protein [Pirellulaceae bacterium]
MDGQPSQNAQGDDTDGKDDDDGVIFNSVLVPGRETEFTITASQPGNLDAWIDLNGNGTFDTDEKIFDKLPLNAGLNQESFLIPAGAVATEQTFARFRFSAAGGLGPTGPAPRWRSGRLSGQHRAGLVVDLPDASEPQDFRLTLDNDDVVLINLDTGAEVDRQPIADVGTIVIAAPAGDNNKLIIDYAAGTIGVPIEFDGGSGGFDVLEITGGDLDTVRTVLIGPGAGSIDIDGDGNADILFANLEPIDTTTSTTKNLDVVFTAASVVDAILEDLNLPGDGQMQLRFTTQSSEDLFFSIPTESIRLTTVGGNSLVQIGAADSLFITPKIALAGQEGDEYRLMQSNVLPDNSEITLDGVELNLNDFDETIASLAGSGTVRLGAGTLTIGNDTSATAYSGSINSEGDLIKQGASSLSMSGSASIGGDVSVTDGTLLVEGSVVARGIVVRDGGVIGGEGSLLAPTIVESGGVLAPTSGVGALRTQSIDLRAGSVLRLDINGPTGDADRDQLLVSGDVALDGSILDVRFASPPNSGDQFMLIDNDGGDLITTRFTQGTAFIQDGLALHIDYFGGDGNDVVLRVAPLDFGDAPSSADTGFANSYPVTLSQDGARHGAGDLFLGTSIDDEADGTADAAASGDDTGASDDEDGVTLIASLVGTTASETTSSVVVHASGPGKLDAWIDFDRDGDWNDASEQIISSVDVTSGANLISFSVPAGASVSDTAARFRLSSAGSLAPTGLAADGEVEDYIVRLQDGDAGSGADVVIEPTEPGTTELLATGNDVVVRRSGTVLFKAPGVKTRGIELLGTEGDDTINLANLDAIFAGQVVGDAGDGADRLNLLGTGHNLDLTELAADALRSLETIDIRGTGTNRLSLNSGNVVALGNTANTVTVFMDPDDDLDTNDDGFEITGTDVVDGQFEVIATSGEATIKIRGTGWTNPINVFDVNNSNLVTPLDALVILNQLSRRDLLDGSVLDDPTSLQVFPNQFLDTTGDGLLTPLDALRILNHLNRISTSGESPSAIATSFAAAFPFEYNEDEEEDEQEVAVNQSPDIL